MEKVTSIKTTIFSSLSKEVEETFGRRIASSRDCIHLSEEIYVKTSFKINPNTLRRVFGLVTAKYPPSSSTLNIISKYCGFDSLEEMQTTQVSNVGNGLDIHSKSILDYMISLFKNPRVKEINDEIYLSLVRQTIEFLMRHSYLADKFQRAIAKTKNGQDFYFEQFINIDKLNSFYGDGLRYYLNEKKTPEAQIFGHSVLCLKSWLVKDHGGLKKHYDEIKKYKLNRTIHPFVCGRYYTAQLLYADANGLNTDRILIDALNAHGTIRPSNENYRLFPGFEYMFSMGLMLTGHFQEMLYYLNHAQKNYAGSHTYLDPGFYHTMKMTKAIALFKTNEKAAAEKIFNQLKPSEFYFLSKKANMIFYLSLALLLNKKQQKLVDQRQELIRETGFTKLNDIFTA